METSIKPKFARVLIKREVQKQTSGGIILPDTAAKRHASCEGIIIGLGETAGWLQTYDESGNPINKQIFKIGDHVIFGRHAGAWLDATYGKTGEANDDGTLFICADEDILAVKEHA